jgi:cell surface protein SprA
VAVALGNTIENSQENAFNAQFNFGNLYAKSRWLRGIDNIPMPGAPKASKSDPNLLGGTLPPKSEALLGLTGDARTQALKKWRQQRRDFRTAEKISRQNSLPELSAWERTAGKFITMFRNVSLNYGENFRSRLPGFMDRARFLGQNFKSMAPGLDYVFGKQPNPQWLQDKINRKLLSPDSNFNFLFRQSFEQRLNLTAQLEPIRELIIDLNLEKSFTKDFSTLIKDTTGSGNAFAQLNPLFNGGFSVSYIAFGTLFRSHNPNELSATFKEFEANRLVLSRRAAERNPYWQSLSPGQQFTPDGFAKGYGRYSQDVLIPSFLAAYTGRDPNSIPLVQQGVTRLRNNPFSGILPRPNWRLTYTGLTKWGRLEETFSNITIGHGYNGNLSLNSFNSALLYQDPFRLNAPGFIDTVSGNFIPFFLVPNLSMRESFEPLFKIEVTTVSQLNVNLEYRKSRQLSLSLIDYQLSETRSSEWIMGLSWRKRGFTLPFRLPFTKGKTLQNDLNLKLDVSVCDVSLSNSRLDQQNAYGTGGQKEVSIQPTIDYVLNNRINIKFFFDQRRVTPYISTSAPLVNTRAGVNVRISLAQ